MKNIYGINVTAPLQGAIIINIHNLWLKPQAILPNLFEVKKYADYNGFGGEVMPQSGKVI